MQPGVSRSTQLSIGCHQNLEKPGEVLLRELGAGGLQARQILGRSGNQVGILARDLDHQQVAKMAHQLANQLLRVPAAGQDLIHQGQDPPGVAGDDGIGNLLQQLLRDHSQQVAHLLFLHLLAAKRNRLVQQRLPVAQAPLGGARDGAQCPFSNENLLFARDQLQSLENLPEADGAEVEVLATGKDGPGHLVQLGRSQDEDHVRRRLFQGFQQRVESLGGQHMNFIDDKHLVAVPRRPVSDALPQFPNLVNAAVGGRVDLENIDGLARGYFPAGWTVITGIDGGALPAVQRLGQDPGRGGLPHSPRSREQIGMGDAILGDGVLEGLRRGALPHDFSKGLRPPLAGQNLIAHEPVSTLRLHPRGLRGAPDGPLAAGTGRQGSLNLESSGVSESTRIRGIGTTGGR